MQTHEERQFRIPIDELRAILKKQHNVDLIGVEPFIDREHIVFSLQIGSAEQAAAAPGPRAPKKLPEFPALRPNRRNRRRKRNRIRTRGWKVMDRIKNSQGLSAKIYEPFVAILRKSDMTRTEQRAAVREIMVRNGNSPGADSIDYYLDNTLEYLKRDGGGDAK